MVPGETVEQQKKVMLPEIVNLYTGEPRKGKERLSALISGKDFTLEHIESFGDRSEDGFWYDQDRPEWVALIRGEAELKFETGTLHLRAGDSLVIAAHLKHRVAGSSTDAVWIALHYTE